MLWGAGTAMGEIPPYAFSYHAARAGIRNEEWDSIFAVRPAAEGQGLLEASINRMKAWMLGFIQRCAGGGGGPAREPRSRAAAVMMRVGGGQIGRALLLDRARVRRASWAAKTLC